MYLMWLVCTPDPSRWASWVCDSGGGRNSRENRLESRVVAERPAHMQRGLSTVVVSRLLTANTQHESERRECAKQLVAKQGTVSVCLALMLMHGAGLLSSQNLQEQYGYPETVKSGNKFLELAVPHLKWKHRNNVRCPLAETVLQ